jgi:hypothetical protein
MRISHQAHISVMADHNPRAYGPNYPKQPDEPISAADAREVFERMDRRFKLWTGMSLAEYVAVTAGERADG